MTSEEINDTSQGSAVIFRGKNDPPPPGGHRRSISDIPLGFSAMMQSSPQLVPISSVVATSMRKNLGNDKHIGLVSLSKSITECVVGIKTEDNVADDMLESFMNMDHANALKSVADGKERGAIVGGTKMNGTDTNIAIVGGTKMNGTDTNIAESETVMRQRISSKERVERTEGIETQFQHYRSLSMDSCMGHFHFDASSTMMQNDSCDPAGQLSGSNSLSENLAKIHLGLGSGEFNEFELKKIMSDERLAEIVTSDPKRVKRILANRQSAARSKERKLRYISELEHKVRTLQTEATTLTAQISILKKEIANLANQNNELNLHIQAMQQQAHLRDALHDKLTAEVQHLKRAKMECREDGGKSSGNARSAPMKHYTFPFPGQQLD